LSANQFQIKTNHTLSQVLSLISSDKSGHHASFSATKVALELHEYEESNSMTDF
jgi:hypothetical protein